MSLSSHASPFLFDNIRYHVKVFLDGCIEQQLVWDVTESAF